MSDNFDLTMSIICGLVSCASVIVVIVLTIWVFRDAKSKNVQSPWLWTLLTLFFPVVGIILYLVIGRKKISPTSLAKPKETAKMEGSLLSQPKTDSVKQETPPSSSLPKKKTPAWQQALIVGGVLLGLVAIYGVFNLMGFNVWDAIVGGPTGTSSETNRCDEIPFTVTRESLDWCNHSATAPGSDKSDWLYCGYSNGNTGFLPPECIPAGVPEYDY